MNATSSMIPVLSSIVVVACLEIIKEILKKRRTPAERETQTFLEMKAIADAYKDVVEVHKQAAQDATTMLRAVQQDLARAHVDINDMRAKIVSLETALDEAHALVTKILSLVQGQEPDPVS